MFESVGKWFGGEKENSTSPAVEKTSNMSVEKEAVLALAIVLFGAGNVFSQGIENAKTPEDLESIKKEISILESNLKQYQDQNKLEVVEYMKGDTVFSFDSGTMRAQAGYEVAVKGKTAEVIYIDAKGNGTPSTVLTKNGAAEGNVYYGDMSAENWGSSEESIKKVKTYSGALVPMRHALQVIQDGVQQPVSAENAVQ